ncbi:MAG TPA: hypothetical protein PKA58_05905 [Polyangium sp.]|jgi:hypothetical protein|nr:hypothetical protein [Polyangium sp.]
MRKRFLPLTTLFVVACGSSPAVKPTEPAKDNATNTATGGANERRDAAEVAVATTTPGTAYDLTPVAEPQDVIALLGWKNPAETLRAFSACADTKPERALDAAEIGMRGILRDVVSSSVDVRGLAAAVAYDAPIFGVASLDPQTKGPGGFVAFSIGLSSLDKAKAAVESAGPLTEISPGHFRIAGRSEPVCIIAPSTGPSPVRLVCGPREKDVVTLAPYLTRTLPAASVAKSDVHVELRLAPAEARYGSLLRSQIQGLPVLAQAEGSIGEPKFDKAVVDAATGVADEVVALVADADKISVDAALDQVSCLNASASLSLRGKTSWLGGIMADRLDRAGPPPAIFWRAPKDSASVFYGRGTDPKKFAPILRTARLLIEGGLAKIQIGSEADHRALSEILDFSVGPYVETVSASGPHPDVPADKLTTPQQEMDSFLGSFTGWTLVGFEEGPAAMSKELKRVADVYARKGYQDALKKALGKKAGVLMPQVKVGPGPAALGAGSLDLSIKVDKLPAAEMGILKTAKGKDTVSAELHVLLMPDGKSRTWMGIGVGKPDDLVKRLLGVKTGAPEDGTIAVRKDLEPLRRGDNMSAGFITMKMFTKSMQRSSKIAGGRRNDQMMEKVLKSFATMPHQGDSPIFVTTTSKGVDAPTGSFNIAASKPVMEDVGWLLKTLAP